MHDHANHDCCHHTGPSPQPKHQHGCGATTTGKAAAYATLHCLTGCVIGEVAGLALGVYFSLGVWPTMLLATALAYIVGFSLAIPPLMRSQSLSYAQAFRAIWLGEAVSIGVMEIAMNATDYAIGGVQASSLTNPIFYIGLATAIPAGFLAAWPINYYLLKKEIKRVCH